MDLKHRLQDARPALLLGIPLQVLIVGMLKTQAYVEVRQHQPHLTVKGAHSNQLPRRHRYCDPEYGFEN